jgi:hypothetical protein
MQLNSESQGYILENKKSQQSVKCILFKLNTIHTQPYIYNVLKYPDSTFKTFLNGLRTELTRLQMFAAGECA